jgi:pimeloyl-ACP methyl ester carboxylesterase
MPFDEAVLTDDFCQAVGYEAPPIEFGQPVHSGVPALLLTGALDATTPSENAAAVASGLPAAVLVEVENAAHEALPAAAAQDVVLDFLRGTDVRGRRVAVGRRAYPPSR